MDAATAIAEKSGAQLVLVRVAPEESVVEAHDYLRALVAPSRGLGGHGERPAVDTAAREGEPAAVLVDEGRRWGAGLLVLATHGRSGLGRWRYGSVADAVLRHADRPLLLVPATCDRAWPRERSSRLLVTLDGSAFAEEALPPARTMAQLVGGEVVLLRAVGTPNSAPFTPAAGEPRSARPPRPNSRALTRTISRSARDGSGNRWSPQERGGAGFPRCAGPSRGGHWRWLLRCAMDVNLVLDLVMTAGLVALILRLVVLATRRAGPG